MLAGDYYYYYLDAILEDYGIEEMTSENDSKMERYYYLVARKTPDSQFIILPGYVAPESTTTTTIFVLSRGCR